MRRTQWVRKTARHTAQRGMTLIEIMIVIVIIGMLATGVTIGLMSNLERSREDTARSEACTIQSAVVLYLAQHPGQCPTMDDLKSGGYLDKKKRTKDPWDREYQIDCAGDEPDVYSTGKDGSGRIACEADEDQ